MSRKANEAMREIDKERAGKEKKAREAVRSGDALGIREAIRDGVDFGRHEVERLLALHELAKNGHAKAIREMARAVDLDQRDPTDPQQQTALHLAAWFRKTEAVEALIKAGASVNAKDAWARTPLMRAVESGDSKSALALLAAGADPRSEDQGGATALMHAAFQGDEKVIERLVEAGADGSKRDQEGRTALHWAVKSWARWDGEKVEALLRAGVDPDARDKTGATAWEAARYHRNHELMRAIESARALREREDLESQTRGGKLSSGARL